MSEQGEAQRDGARLQPNSGRGFKKADAIKDDLSIDYKEYGKSFSISRSVWAKVCSDAMANGLDYVPVIKVILGAGSKLVRLAVIEWSYLEYLKECEKELNRLDSTR